MFSRKSQIALEYIFRRRSPDTAVFWVHASSVARFMDSYKHIASDYQLPGRDDPTLDILQLVRDWLNTQCPFDWFMVIDNVDERAGFLEGSEQIETKKALYEYIPQSARGSILYTTRSRDIGIDLSLDKDPIMVQCLGFDDARALLGESLVAGAQRDDLLALFDHLDYLPLAISQAAAFMIKRRKGVADYLILLRDDSTRSQILSQKGHHHGRAERSSESVVSTWWVTFRSIKRENPRAAELLAMMSLLDRHEIPVSILQDPNEETFGFEEAIGLLKDFSLITTSSGATLCSERALELLSQMTHNHPRNSLVFGEMHGLVQESTKTWLSQSEGNAAETAMKTLCTMASCLDSDYKTWALCDLIYPHVNASASYNLSLIGVSREYSQECWYSIICMLHNVSENLHHRSRFEKCEQNSLLVMRLCRMYLGDHDTTTLDKMEWYAYAICSSNKHEEARDIQSQVLHIREGSLGHQDPQTLRSVANLGEVLAGMGDLEGAEKLLRRSFLSQRENHLENPEDTQLHAGLIQVMTRLASVFVGQGEHQNALDLLNEALEFLEAWNATNGCLNYLYRHIMLQLAEYYFQCGKYRNAHIFIERVFFEFRGLFDSTNPLNLRLGRELANLLWAEGRCDETEELLKALYRAWVEVDDSDHKLSTDVLCNIGDIQYCRGKFEEAEKTFGKALQVIVGDRQGWIQDTAQRQIYIQRAISQCQENRGQIEDGKACMLPSEHTSALDTEEASGAKKWRQKGRDSVSASQFEISVATSVEKSVVRIQNPKIDHNAQETRIGLALDFFLQERYEEAYELAQPVLAFFKYTKGWHYSSTRDCVLLLACTTKKLGKNDESEDLWGQVLHWQNYQFRRDQYIVFNAYSVIARLRYRREDFEGAEEACKSALAVPSAFLKKVNPETILQARHNLGCVLLYQDKFKEAEDAFNEAYDYGVAMFGSYEPSSIEDLICLTEAAESAGSSDRLEELHYLLGTTIALPLDGRAEDFDESASESDYEISDGEEDFEESASNSLDRDSMTMALPSDGKEEEYGDSASESEHDSVSSDWETTDSDSSRNGD